MSSQPKVKPKKSQEAHEPTKPSTRALTKSTHDFFIWVGAVEFRVWWFIFLAFHGVCLGYHVCAACLYRLLPTTALSTTLTANAVGMDAAYHPLIATIMALLAAVHCGFMLSMVGFSIHAKQFTYFPIRQSKKPVVSALVQTDPSSNSLVVSPPSGGAIATTEGAERNPRRSMRNSIVQSVTLVLGPSGLLDVTGKHFVTIFLFREIVEVVLQTVQVYRLALYVPRPWLVRSLAILLVLNCWSTPLFHRVIRKHPGRKRMACLLFDVTTDGISAIVIPLILVLPYLSQYDPAYTSFPVEKFRDTTWRVVALNEFRLVLVSSWIDLFTRVLLTLSSTIVLLDVKKLLRAIPREAAGVTTATTHKATTKRDKVSGAASYVIETDAAPPLTRLEQLEKKLDLVLEFVITSFGLAVLIIHITAEAAGHSDACMLPVLTWGSSDSGCAYVLLNCAAVQILGARDEMQALISLLEPKSLQALDIVACSQLEMPPALQKLTQILNLRLIHSSVAVWDEQAALTAQHHPHITSLSAVFVELPGGVFPPGLTSSDFPPTLATVDFIHSYVDSLPYSMVVNAAPNSIMVFNYNGMTTFPAVLVEMPIFILSVGGNNITEVPALLFMSPWLQVLDLSRNPITEIPEIPEALLASQPIPAPRLVTVDMTLTQLNSYPSWLKGRRVGVIASQTPLCERILANNLTEQEQYLRMAVVCVPLEPGGG